MCSRLDSLTHTSTLCPDAENQIGTYMCKRSWSRIYRNYCLLLFFEERKRLKGNSDDKAEWASPTGRQSNETNVGQTSLNAELIVI